jgi:3'(2'), 5'-bisphosphate nucleotidase
VTVADDLIEIAKRAALAAGDAILKVYAQDFTVAEKSDRTPVTEADLAAEGIILEALGAAFPDIPILSEERVEKEGLPPSAARFWAVDPLDGTREFIARNGEFAVNIALVEDHRPILGVVYGPARRVLYCAHGPGTATRQEAAGAPQRISARRPPTDGLVVVHSRSHGDSRRLAEFLRDFPVRERRSCGSALKFGLLASGAADLYPRFGTTMEWDTAAGDAILAAAGGRVLTLAGTPLAYGKPGFRNDGFIACGRPAEA